MSVERQDGAAAGDKGQAAVEVAIALPIVVVVVLGLVQIGVAIRNEVAVELAAREGARAASVSAAPDDAAARAARRAVDLPIGVDTAVSGDVVAVTVTYTDHTSVPIIGHLLGPVTHSATVSMSREPP